MRTLVGSTAFAISGRTSMVRLLRRNARVSPTMKAGGSSLPPARMMATVRGRGSGGGARRDVGVGHAPGQRHGQRAPDRRALGGERLELGASQPQHQAVAQRGDGGGARTAGKEGDLAERLAGAELGHRLAAPGDGDGEAPRHHHEERIRHLALTHQHVAAPERSASRARRQGGSARPPRGPGISRRRRGRARRPGASSLLVVDGRFLGKAYCKPRLWRNVMPATP